MIFSERQITKDTWYLYIVYIYKSCKGFITISICACMIMTGTYPTTYVITIDESKLNVIGGTRDILLINFVIKLCPEVTCL